MHDDDTPRTEEERVAELMARYKTPPEMEAALYLAAYELAAGRVADGMHPDAIRAGLHMLELDFAAAWRGAEDAIAGRPPAA